jgi:hypothetical protein
VISRLAAQGVSINETVRRTPWSSNSIHASGTHLPSRFEAAPEISVNPGAITDALAETLVGVPEAGKAAGRKRLAFFASRAELLT